MRDLMAVTARPEVISLAGGLPDTSTFPPETFAAVAQRIAAESCAKALQYGPTDGLAETKDCIAEVMQAEGMELDRDDTIVTTGGQQVIDLVAKTLIDPGDVVIAEGPTYPGAVPVFLAYQADVVQIEMDSAGMRVDLLEETLARLAREGRRPKFIYTVPTFQNPAGVTMSLSRRRRLVELAHEHELLVLEDNPYGLLGFDGEPIPSLRSLNEDQVIYLSSFSKTFAPGFRVGWVLAPHAVREKLVLAQEAATLCPPAFSQFAVAAYLANHDWRGQIKIFREMYRERRDAMITGLTSHMPACTTWTYPEGGFFVWLTLPPGIDSHAMLPRAVTARVAYVPGTAIYADRLGSRHMRLSYCFPTPERIIEGTRRLGEVLEYEASMLEIFGTAVESESGRLALGPREAPGPNQA